MEENIKPRLISIFNGEEVMIGIFNELRTI
jgi:hypothetical protein